MPTSTLAPPPNDLAAADFGAFFNALHGRPDAPRPPLPWQTRLAQRAAAGDWPAYLKLPTASGKTAALDIAVFALAVQACRHARHGEAITAARRIFFVVDRRIIVNEAFRRMRDGGPDQDGPDQGVAGKLNAALASNGDTDPVLVTAARWLQWLTGDPQAPALDAVELRGGIYRDDAWVRSPRQPTVVCSTVDQIGSRMLFRGYGVNDRALPVHAALTTHDVRILLDEAHCARPFRQTVAGIRRLLEPRFAKEPLPRALELTEMTATPPADADPGGVFQLDQATDYAEGSLLAERHGAPRPVVLAESTAKGKALVGKLSKDLAAHAEALAEVTEDRAPRRRIGVVVNRVNLARRTFELLNKKHPGRVDLMIGRMRPIDRDELTKRLQGTFGSGSTETLDAPRFVVATQCLEVGADLDFDGMVCQAASLDALRQRFGRLDRLGRAADPRGVVVITAEDQGAKAEDPIYGEAIRHTWTWLQEQATDGVVDFGVRSFGGRWAQAVDADPQLAQRVNAPVVDAPTLMPAHADLLVQTSPRPTLNPDVSLFLHGPGRPRREVSVCWRADLYAPDRDDRLAELLDAPAAAAVRGTPPSRAECVSVPLATVRDWLRGKPVADGGADVEGEQAAADAGRPVDDAEVTSGRWGLVYRGGQTPSLINGTAEKLKRLQPDAVLVLPVEQGGWDELAHLPDAPGPAIVARVREAAETDTQRAGRQEARFALAAVDVADAAFKQSRARDSVRTHPHLARSATEKKALRESEFQPHQRGTWPLSKIRARLAEVAEQPEPTHALNRLANALGPDQTLTAFKAGFALVLRGPLRKLGARERVVGGQAATGDASSFDAAGPISLADHTADVVAELDALLAGSDVLTPCRETLREAANRHDWGKLDPRFQARLRGVRPEVAGFAAVPLAKSGRTSDAPDAVDISGLPSGFRHETLSVSLSHRAQVTDGVDRGLMDHLIATHHGLGRPFFPVATAGADAPPLGVNLAPVGIDLTVSARERMDEVPAHRLGSASNANFWTQVRRWGWWGVARLEACLRLADWAASARPGARCSGDAETTVATPRAVGANTPPARSLVLPGLDGANPLGFLAALGTLRVLDAHVSGLRMGWVFGPLGQWCPQLELPADVPDDEAGFVDYLTERLLPVGARHPLVLINEIDEVDLVTGKADGPNAYARSLDADDPLNGLDRWLTANGSDIAPPDANSRLQTARRDYFPGGVSAIVDACTSDHLVRSLFRAWDYADPLKKTTLHLEPREDRRHAYQWNKPEQDKTKAHSGGMLGANRLAAEAWPLLPVWPVWDSAAKEYTVQTLGFRGLRSYNTSWAWPLWSDPLTLDVVASALALRFVLPRGAEQEHRRRFDGDLIRRGVVGVRQLRRILVGKTPNFTPSVPLLETSGKPNAAIF